MTEQIISAKFNYNGKPRIVDNITIDEDKKILCGFEMRASGQFSYQIKKFSMDKVTDMVLIDPVHRSGPAIGRP